MKPCKTGLPPPQYCKAKTTSQSFSMQWLLCQHGCHANTVATLSLRDRAALTCTLGVDHAFRDALPVVVSQLFLVDHVLHEHETPRPDRLHRGARVDGNAMSRRHLLLCLQAGRRARERGWGGGGLSDNERANSLLLIPPVNMYTSLQPLLTTMHWGCGTCDSGYPVKPHLH